jgi:hypothetical protein
VRRQPGVGSSDGDSELLRNVDAHRSAQMISSILQAIGVGLLAAPLYLPLPRRRRAQRDDARPACRRRHRAPLFLAVLAILSGLSNLSAASDFVGDEVPRLMAKGVALSSDRANDVAGDTITDAPLRPLAAGFGLGGQIGFVVAMFYTSLHAMRTGLLTRFWGSLGMALGAVSFIFFQFALLWFSLPRLPDRRLDSQAADRRPGRAAKPSPGRRPARNAPDSGDE